MQIKRLAANVEWTVPKFSGVWNANGRRSFLQMFSRFGQKVRMCCTPSVLAYSSGSRRRPNGVKMNDIADRLDACYNDTGFNGPQPTT